MQDLNIELPMVVETSNHRLEIRRNSKRNQDPNTCIHWNTKAERETRLSMSLRQALFRR